MLIPPIPFYLLKQNVTVKKKVGFDKWDNPVYEEYLLKNVRVERKAGLVYTKDKVKENVNAVLFIDAVRSSGLCGIEADDVVVFDGEEMTVKSVGLFCGLDGVTPHHWEVELT